MVGFARATREHGTRVPVMRGAPVLGTALQLRDDYLGTILRAAHEVGDVARLDAGPPGWRSTFYNVSTPELVSEILGQPDRFTKATPSYEELRIAFGNGMLTSEGDVWRRQRRFLAPMFTPKRIATTYTQIMVAETIDLVERWRVRADRGEVIDVHAEMTGLTSRIIGRILFGADMTSALPEIMGLKFVNDTLLMRGISPHAVPMWVPTRTNRRLAEGLRRLRGVVADIITERRNQPPSGPADDMLGLLLNARDDGDAQDNDHHPGEDRLTDAEVADQTLIFLLAGHDTTASTLACLLVELARAPQWQDTVHQELGAVLGDRPATARDLPRLPWTGRAVREAMRLYPAAHSIGRTSVADELLGGYRIPAGSTVVICPWTVHRSPQVWTDPETFDPRRFDLPAGEFPGGHRYAWFPFGAGPHACVGMQLAMVEAPVVLATILQAFRVTTTVRSIPLRAAISLHPVGPLPLTLHPR